MISAAGKGGSVKIAICALYAHSAKSGAIELATRRRSARNGSLMKKAQLAADTAGFTWQNSMHLNARTTAPNDSLFARADTYVALSPRNLLPGRPSSMYPRSNPNHRRNLHSAYQVNYEVSVTTQLHYDYCTDIGIKFALASIVTYFCTRKRLNAFFFKIYCS